MPAKTNSVTSEDVSRAREIVFASAYTQRIQFIKDIFGDVRFQKVAPGEQLIVKKTAVTLNPVTVGEGESIPYNKVKYESKPIGEIKWDKQKIGVSLEAIGKSGYAGTIAPADKDAIYKMTSKLVDNFIAFAKTGTLTVDGGATFQMGVARSVGNVKNKWDAMDKSSESVIGFCNMLDAYDYLGAANITTQQENGLSYLKDFMGFSKLFLTSKVETGKIIATPSNNIVIPYIDMRAADYTKAGFNFHTDGELNLIATHVEPNYDTGMSELLYITALDIIAEFLDGIAVTTFGSTGA